MPPPTDLPPDVMALGVLSAVLVVLITVIYSCPMGEEK